MKIKLIGTPEIIMQNPDSPHNYFAWPTVSRLKDSRLAVTASGFRIGHVCPFGKTIISYSKDNGKTYTPPTPVIDTPLDDRDGGLCPFGENGFIVTSFNNTVEFQRETAASINNEKSRAYRNAYLDTVDPEAEERYLGVTYRVTLDGGVTFSEVKKSPVSSPHGPIELRSGKIMWLGRRMYPNDPDPRDEKIPAFADQVGMQLLIPEQQSVPNLVEAIAHTLATRHTLVPILCDSVAEMRKKAAKTLQIPWK